MNKNPNKHHQIETTSDNAFENFKGIYFNDDNNQEYYEYGAHFSIATLRIKLEELAKNLDPSRLADLNYYIDTEENKKEKKLPSNILFKKLTNIKVSFFNYSPFNQI